jgi:hypothetical protein
VYARVDVCSTIKQKRSAGCGNIVNLRCVKSLQTATGLLCGVVAVGLNFVTTQPVESQARSRRPPNCSQFGIETKASQPLRGVTLPPSQGCHTRAMNGLPVPDPACTPGAINPTVTIAVLRNPAFRTVCIRQQATTPHEKAQTYSWYSIRHPANNTGGSQTCELDHLVSLELGGADTLDNIWPQCGPPGVGLDERYFKQKELSRLARSAWRDGFRSGTKRNCHQLDSISRPGKGALRVGSVRIARGVRNAGVPLNCKSCILSDMFGLLAATTLSCP